MAEQITFHNITRSWIPPNPLVTPRVNSTGPKRNRFKSANQKYWFTFNINVNVLFQRWSWPQNHCISERNKNPFIFNPKPTSWSAWYNFTKYHDKPPAAYVFLFASILIIPRLYRLKRLKTKELLKINEAGIFTIKQLKYTGRPMASTSRGQIINHIIAPNHTGGWDYTASLCSQLTHMSYQDSFSLRHQRTMTW